MPGRSRQAANKEKKSKKPSWNKVSPNIADLDADALFKDVSGCQRISRKASRSGGDAAWTPL